MAKMSFPTTVNYNGIIYPATAVFTVKESDVQELRKKGGWVIQSETPKTTKSTQKVETKKD